MKTTDEDKVKTIGEKKKTIEQNDSTTELKVSPLVEFIYTQEKDKDTPKAEEPDTENKPSSFGPVTTESPKPQVTKTPATNKDTNKDDDDAILNNPNVKTSISVISVTSSPDSPTTKSSKKETSVQVVTPTPSVLPLTSEVSDETPAVIVEATKPAKPTRPSRTRTTRKRPSRLTMPNWVSKPTEPTISDTDENESEVKPEEDESVEVTTAKPTRTTRTRRTRGTFKPVTKAQTDKTTRTRRTRPSRLSFNRKTTAAPEIPAVEEDQIEEAVEEEN